MDCTCLYVGMTFPKIIHGGVGYRPIINTTTGTQECFHLLTASGDLKNGKELEQKIY